MKMTMMMFISLSMSFFLLNHPLSLGFILLTMTILTTLITGTMNSTFWFSYIMFLVMIGGMLILFVYMTSVASNEKFKFSFKIILANMATMSLMMFLIKNSDQTFSFLKLKETNMMNSTINLSTMNLKYFTPSLNIIMISAMIYLLISLIMTVKITKKIKGPLRQKI